MRAEVEDRQPGHVPLGAFLMVPLFFMPLGGWLLEQGHVDFGVCAMKAVFSLPCMTCGATRATMRLLHGDLLGALYYQPLMMAIYAGLAIWGAISLATFARGRRVRLHFGNTESLVLKVVFVLFPLATWAYLIAMGI